jgi:hypothetical protein
MLRGSAPGKGRFYVKLRSNAESSASVAHALLDGLIRKPSFRAKQADFSLHSRGE